MGRKKPAWRLHFSEMVADVRKHRLVAVVTILAIAIIAGFHSNTAEPPSKLSDTARLGISITPAAHHQPPRQPDNAPKSVMPLLLPWRGPVSPMSTEPGTAPVIYDIPTADPVVFLTIDDGVHQSPETAKWLISHRMPFTLFLDDHAVRNDYPYFVRLDKAGMNIQNHTVNHPRLKTLGFDQQKTEICGASDIFANVFGKRPVLFRPPYGQFNDDTRRAVSECGLKAIVMWRAVVENGQIYFQHDKTHLEAGDIVLMHFRPNFMEDMGAFTRQVQKDHLRVGRLEDWLK